jgi:hypothetical protein
MRSQPRGRQKPRRDQRQQRAPAMPWEREQERVRKEQLEYARAQEAQERRSAPQQAERRGEKQPQTPALFGLVGKKTGQ